MGCEVVLVHLNLGRKGESATREGGATEKTPREGDSKDDPDSHAAASNGKERTQREEKTRERAQKRKKG